MHIKLAKKEGKEKTQKNGDCLQGFLGSVCIQRGEASGRKDIEMCVVKRKSGHFRYPENTKMKGSFSGKGLEM